MTKIVTYKSPVWVGDHYMPIQAEGELVSDTVLFFPKGTLATQGRILEVSPAVTYSTDEFLVIYVPTGFKLPIKIMPTRKKAVDELKLFLSNKTEKDTKQAIEKSEHYFD